jgi:HemK-related putative methylase
MHRSTSASLISDRPPGRIGLWIGWLLAVFYRVTGYHRYDQFRLERVGELRVLVIPTVANPKALRTGAYFSSLLNAESVSDSDEVLDLGTGSGVCALSAARHARRVVATDINPAAVRCARINACINNLEERIDVRDGDLFEPVARERFDLVLFNPPFLSGVPKNHRDAAWRSADAAQRFAEELADHLKPNGSALLLLSSFGDACGAFEAELSARGFNMMVFARKLLINETITVLRVNRSSSNEESL